MLKVLPELKDSADLKVLKVHRELKGRLVHKDQEDRKELKEHWGQLVVKGFKDQEDRKEMLA